MTAKQNISIDDFIASHRTGLAFILKIKESEVSDSDIKVLCQYLTPEIKLDAANGRVNPAFIDKIKTMQVRGLDQSWIAAAIDVTDRASVFGKRLSNSIKSNVSFSPSLEALLETRRKEYSRKSFKALASSFIDLKSHMVTMRDLLESEESFNSPGFRFQLNATIKMLKADLRKCDHHARSGMSWAIKSGVPIDKAYMAVNQIYLRHLKQIEHSFKVVDQLLNSQGLKCTMSDIANRTRHRWVDDVNESKQLLSNNQQRCKEDEVSEFAL